jgi:beta-hydroxylase
MLTNNIYILILVIIILFKLRKFNGLNNINMNDYTILSNVFITHYNKWCALNSLYENISFPIMKLNFPNHNILKNNWEQIRNEAMNIYNKGYTTKIKDDNIFFNEIADDGWKKFYIKWYESINDKAFELCPITSKLIQQLPEIKTAMFSILEPGSKIIPHAGPFKGCIRYHLGLDCPEDAFITINGIKYNWKNGEDVLFDDTFIHYVNNNSDKIRLILFCDIDRKMKHLFYEKINNSIINCLAPIISNINDFQEKQIKIKL